MVNGSSEPGTDSTRLDRLKWARDVAQNSITEADVDKRSPLLGQFREILKEIAELESDAPVAKESNGLVVLQEELAKRQQSGSTPARRATRRNV